MTTITTQQLTDKFVVGLRVRLNGTYPSACYTGYTGTISRLAPTEDRDTVVWIMVNMDTQELTEPCQVHGELHEAYPGDPWEFKHDELELIRTIETSHDRW